jgi:hypothetical protein
MATQSALTPPLRDADTGPALDLLLTRWRGHLAAIPEAEGDDTAAVITWPSRDVSGVQALVRHGLQPMAVIAARPVGRAAPPGGVPGVVIREAGTGDVDAVTEMQMGLIRYDALFGGSVPRPATKTLVRQDARAALSRQPSWIWLAERNRVPVGLIAVQPPPEAAWITGMTGPAPAAYLQAGFTAPAERGCGRAGPACARLLDRAGIAVTLLHYAQVNRLSGQFWTRMGYRPLWQQLGGPADGCAALTSHGPQGARCRPWSRSRARAKGQGALAHSAAIRFPHGPPKRPGCPAISRRVPSGGPGRGSGHPRRLYRDALACPGSGGLCGGRRGPPAPSRPG